MNTSKKEAALQKEKVMNKAEQEIRGLILEAAVEIYAVLNTMTKLCMTNF